ncbi:MAG: hypothetical protein NTY53_15685, partial [Kiritimatiellaeota bacterium]|nr:hypothetical protein [Kiritimatiellota bacterium]
ALDTTSDFHVYRIATQGKDVKVFVDDVLRLAAPGAYSKPVAGQLNQIAFGASDSYGVGEALWSSVRAHVDSRSCQDLVLQVTYPRAAK